MAHWRKEHGLNSTVLEPTDESIDLHSSWFHYHHWRSICVARVGSINKQLEEKGMTGKVYTLCPKCGYPLQLQEAVDSQHCITESAVAELSLPYTKDPTPVQILTCGRCGYRKIRILPGLPDDEKSYVSWAQDEADLVARGVLP